MTLTIGPLTNFGLLFPVVCFVFVLGQIFQKLSSIRDKAGIVLVEAADILLVLFFCFYLIVWISKFRCLIRYDIQRIYYEFSVNEL